LHQTIDSIRATNPAAVPSIAHFWLIYALAERDPAAARDAVIASGEKPIVMIDGNVHFNRPFTEGVIARMTKDDEKARSAFIAAWIGDKELACEQLASVIQRPSGPSYGQLKLLPFWDPLRGDPRFEKIVEEAKQAVALKW